MTRQETETVQDDERLIAAWRGTGAMEVRARLRRYKGRDYFDLRLHVRRDDGKGVPTRKGISLPVEDLEHVAAAVAEAQRVVEDDGA